MNELREPTQPEKKEESNIKQEGKELLGKRILVVDDEKAVLGLSIRVLESLGPIIETASNGQELIDKLEAWQYDLIISDNNMPVMGGLDALKKIRSDDRFKNLPFVLNSAIMNTELAEEIKSLGGVPLEKPWTPNQLRATAVKAIIEKAV